jgi:Tfp pilus assembly protein PilF
VSAENSGICEAGRTELFVKSWCAAMNLEIVTSQSLGPERAAAIDKAREGVVEAMREDPENAQLLGALASSYASQGEWLERSRLLERALAIDATMPGVLQGYGIVLSEVGRMAEGTDQFVRQFAAMPLWSSGIRAARILASQGEWQKAREVYDQVRRIEPARVASHEISTAAWYAHPEDAQAILEKRAAEAGLSASVTLCHQEIINARRGAEIEREQILLNCGGMGPPFIPRNLAIIGDYEGALDELERQIAEPSYGFPLLFYAEMRPLWAKPRFWKIADKTGLIEYWTKSGRWPDFCSERDLAFDCKKMAEAAVADKEGAPLTE